MCGILLSVGLGHEIALNKNSKLVELLRHRGPDGTSSKAAYFRRLHNENELASTGGIPLAFVASVLALRGDDLVLQPLEDEETGSLFCWNGEAWKCNNEVINGNDTIKIQQDLLAAAQRNRESRSHYPSEKPKLESRDYVMQFLASISGPFAFVFYDKINARIYFGRDPLGRRSLLFKDSQHDFSLSSVGDGDNSWTEVDSNAIFVIHFDAHAEGYLDVTGQFTNDTNYLTGQGLRISSLPWAAYGRSERFNRDLNPAESEILGVSSTAVSTLEMLLTNSMALRVQHKRIEAPIVLNTTFRSRYAVLFSGGLDCSILARLLHDQLPLEATIDLLNVAFENPRLRSQVQGTSKSLYDICPDRITARKSFEELSLTCADRNWRLVEIDISYAEYRRHRDTIVSLMHPHETEMDLSIAMALYFAARAQGNWANMTSGTKQPYKSDARVLFSGLGADELFGGYQRHATAFSRQGYEGLLDALELDITRLGKRNLGRDDRVMAHWGKEARYPYLDEDFVKWAVETPVWNKCGFGKKEPSANEEVNIEPGKQVLRLLALKLGLVGLASEKKRAIQFGARTAKMERRSKGTETISSRDKEDKD